MIELISGGAPRKITCMPDKSEAEIQKEVAEVVESYGFSVRLEVTVCATTSIKKKAMRLDVVGFYENTPILVFEVKTPKTIHGKGSHYHEQRMLLTHYTNNGLPSSFVSSKQEAIDFMERFVVTKGVGK